MTRCIAVVGVSGVGYRSTDVQVFDAVGSADPGGCHTDGHTHSKVNLFTEELAINSMD